MFLGDALKCYSCEFEEGPDACENHHIMTCTNSTYCLSKYATVNDQDIWAHSCAQDLFEDDIMGELNFLPDPIYCQALVPNPKPLSPQSLQTQSQPSPAQFDTQFNPKGTGADTKIL